MSAAFFKEFQAIETSKSSTSHKWQRHLWRKRKTFFHNSGQLLRINKTYRSRTLTSWSLINTITHGLQSSSITLHSRRKTSMRPLMHRPSIKQIRTRSVASRLMFPSQSRGQPTRPLKLLSKLHSKIESALKDWTLTPVKGLSIPSHLKRLKSACFRRLMINHREMTRMNRC